MNEEKSIWKKSWHGWGLIWVWAILVAATMLIISVIVFFLNGTFRGLSEITRLLALGVGVVTLLFGLWRLACWLCCWRNVKKFLFGAACAATVIALFYAEEDWRGWHAWNQFKHEWEAKGEKFDMTGVTPPPVPAGQNFALAPIWVESMKAVLGPQKYPEWFGGDSAENGRTNFVDRLDMHIFRTDDCGWQNSPTNGHWARTTLTDLGQWQSYYRAASLGSRKDAPSTNEFPIAPQPQTPAADVLLALSKYDGAIEELRTASQQPYSRFPLNYACESPAAILLPHLAKLKGCTQVLRLRALAELQAGQSSNALADVKLALYLTGASRSEPFLITHLVRLAQAQIVIQTIWEGCARHEWTEEQLAALEPELARLDFTTDYQQALRGEMAMQDTETDRLRRHPENLQDIEGEGDFEGGQARVSLPGGPVARLIPAGWFYQNQFRADRILVNYYLPAVDASRGVFLPAVARRGDAAVAADTKSHSAFNIIERMTQSWLHKAPKKFAYGQASVNLARTALALERYRLAHAEYPEALPALVPQFLAQVPNDVIDGQPLKYRRTADGRFVLYSVGWNETDDGGVPAFESGPSAGVDYDHGDWVWTYPQP